MEGIKFERNGKEYLVEKVKGMGCKGCAFHDGSMGMNRCSEGIEMVKDCFKMINFSNRTSMIFVRV